MSGYYRNVRQPPPRHARERRSQDPKCGKRERAPIPSWLQKKSWVRGWGARDAAAVQSGSCLCLKWHFPDKSVWFSQVSACRTQLFSTIFCLPNTAAQQGQSEVAQKLKTKCFPGFRKASCLPGRKTDCEKNLQTEDKNTRDCRVYQVQEEAPARQLQPAKNHGGFQFRNAPCFSTNQKCLSEMWMDAGLYA